MDQPAPSPPAAFGLSAEETKQLGELFGEALASLGLDGERLFAALAEGRPLTEALGLPAGAVDLLYGRAHQWFAVGRPDRAEPLFRTLCLLAAAPDHLVGYGVCLAARGAHAPAAAVLNDAARMRPDWPLPHLRLADIALRQGDLDAARRALAAYDARAAGAAAGPLAAEAARLRRALEIRAFAEAGGAGP